MAYYDRPIEQLLAELPLTLKAQPNLTRRATIGVAELYTRIRNSTARQGTGHAPSYIVTAASGGGSGGVDVVASQLSVMVARYKCVEHIADGTFSQIFRAVDLHTTSDADGGSPVAVKLMQELCNVLGMRELTMLYHLQSSCRHTQSAFVRITDAFSFHNRAALVMEYFPYTLIDLFVHPRGLRADASGTVIKQPRAIRQQDFSVGPRTRPSTNVKAVRRLASTLVKALWILQQKGIIHADIKPENVFLQPVENVVSGGSFNSGSTSQSALMEELLLHGNVKLGDFGNALHISEASDYFKNFEIQSLPYRAPEVLMRHPFDEAIDMWSLGVLLVEVYLQEPLFTVTTKQELHAMIEQKLGPIVIHGSAAKSPFPETSLPGSWKRHTKPLSASVGYLQGVQRLLAGAPADFIAFVAGLLQADPSNRLTPLSALKHPFLSGTSDLACAPLLNPAIATEPENYEAPHIYQATHAAEVKIEEIHETAGAKRTVVYHSVLETQLQGSTKTQLSSEKPLLPSGSSSDRSLKRAIPRDDDLTVSKSRDAGTPTETRTNKGTHRASAIKQEVAAFDLESSSEDESERSSQHSDNSKLRRFRRGTPSVLQSRRREIDLTEEIDDMSSARSSSDDRAPRRRRTDGNLPMFAQLASPPPNSSSRRRTGSTGGRRS